MTKSLLPVVLLSSGVALTACALIFTFAKGPATPPVFFLVMLAGVLDGLAGLVVAAATILWGSSATPEGSRPGTREGAGPAPAPIEAERERDMMRKLVLASGVLSIVFLGLLAAIAFQIPLIIQWIRGCGAF